MNYLSVVTSYHRDNTSSLRGQSWRPVGSILRTGHPRPGFATFVDGAKAGVANQKGSATMVEVELEERIQCSPEAWLEFVLDVHRYAEVDDKIGPIQWARRRGNLVTFEFRPRLPGLNLPALRIVSLMQLTPDTRIDVRLAPRPRNMISRLLSRFEASFSCRVHDHGIQVRRAISFDFAPPIRSWVEPTLRQTLPESVERELCLSKAVLEGATRR